jgi:hypothetical protein
MKPKLSTAKPDPELAKWCEALCAPAVSDVVPQGWYTTKQLAEKMGKPRSVVARLLHDAVAQGRCEKGNFRINVGSFTRATPHYRLP